ncbi:MAG: 3-oxoacyl-ACP reductase FabG [Deltaproteobacteria bacterium]
MEFKDKVVLVTGAAQGIGKGTALAFAKQGASVVINDVNEELTQEPAGEVASAGVTSLAIVADISVSSEVKGLFQQVIERFGTLDVLVNNAAVTRDAFLHKMTEEQWKKVMDVDLTGTFYCLQAAAGIMRAQGRGAIINISSDARFGNAGQANYSAAKAGLIGLTKTAALELARNNVRVNAVSPGPIETAMIQALPEKVLKSFLARVPMGRAGPVEELAELILFLASDRSSFITGQVINCDGGWFMC